MKTKKYNVIQVAKQLFRDKGVSDYSVQDIIEKSEISKGTFYNYFSSKNEFFIAYLEAAKADELARREALMKGESILDRDIFAKQILVRVQVNREYTLLPIFEIAFYSGDDQLKKYTQQRYIDELHWVATRLIDIYGADAQMYAEDCAVLFHGMLQNTIQTNKMIGKRSIDFLAIIYYVLQQIDLIMKRMIIVQDVSLFSHQFGKSDDHVEAVATTDIVQSLTSLQSEMPSSFEHIHESITFLLDEVQKDNIRVHIVRPVVLSLKNMLDRTEWAKMYQPTHEQLMHHLYIIGQK